MKYTIKIDKLLPYSVQEVWQVVTDQQMLSSWFMPTHDFEAKLNHNFTFQMKPQRGWDGVTHCKVLELDPGRHIAFSYRGSATGEKTLACANVDSEIVKTAAKGIFTELDTILEFTLTPEYTANGMEQTRFVLKHSGFNGIKLAIVGRVMGFGWRNSVLPRLGTTLDRFSHKELPTHTDLRSEVPH